jgi:predicted cupin superfamily sugar epimerase
LVKKIPTYSKVSRAYPFFILNKHAKSWIKKLNLDEHPEGGYFAITYKSHKIIKLSEYNGARSLFTTIYYLLTGNQFSSFHIMKSDEIWHFYSGSSLTLHIIDSNGRLNNLVLGPNFNEGEMFQAIVKSGCWFAASVNEKKSYSLVGCTVSPGFDYRDWKIGNRKRLIEMYPQHKKIILKYTRSVGT